MKRILSLCLIAALAAVLLAGCAGESPATQAPNTSAAASAIPQTQAPSTPDPEKETPLEPILSVEAFPRVDGSTACLPLIARVMADTTGISEEDAQDVSWVSTTAASYDALLAGEADILLVYEPAEETAARIAQSPVELDFTPIGSDALVFITNTGNPVGNITTQQLIDIYMGKTKNWNELGGEDSEIMPFQRDPESGSQALFMKLLMQNTQPMEAPTEMVPQDMGELLEALASYKNTKNAIGYSVYYYASQMYAVEGLKMLSVDGVEPSSETIASGEYPFLNQFYVVVRADEPADSPAMKLREYIRSENGKKAITESGYVALSE